MLKKKDDPWTPARLKKLRQKTCSISLQEFDEIETKICYTSADGTDHVSDFAAFQAYVKHEGLKDPNFIKNPNYNDTVSLDPKNFFILENNKPSRTKRILNFLSQGGRWLQRASRRLRRA